MSSSFELRLTTDNEDATLALAEAMGRVAQPGDFIGLGGDLGAGKTTFTRGFAAGCEVDPGVPVCSPTFTLANIYPGDRPVYHLDLYRLSDEDELEAIGFRDYADGRAIVLIEWWHIIPGVLPPDSLLVQLELIDLERRTITLRANGPRSQALLEAARAQVGE